MIPYGSPFKRISETLQAAGKEYAKADSRYASRDPFTICMEFVTAFIEGPSCFIIVYGLVRKRAWRHVLQLLVVTCQVYGDVLYFATSWYEGEDLQLNYTIMNLPMLQS